MRRTPSTPQSCSSPQPHGQPAHQQPHFSFGRQQQSAPVVNLILVGGATNCADTNGPIGCISTANVDNAADSPDSYSISSPTMNSFSHSAPSEASRTSEFLNASDSLTLICNTPPGIEVVYSPQKGHHIVASANFATGTVLYHTSALVIRRQYDSIAILIDGVRYELSTPVNTIARVQQAGTRSVFGFDSFMNHSCVPNVWTPFEHADAEWEYYTCMAARDIKPGDEITCDYAASDYDCDGHMIEECWCSGNPASDGDKELQPGADVHGIVRMKCRGAMLGFGALTFEQKLEILWSCDEAIIKHWEQEERVRVVDVRSAVPPSVVITLGPKSTQNNILVAARPFAQNEEFFCNRPYLVCADEYDIQWILRTGEREFRVLTAHQHFIHREGYREMLGFDTFMNHSCEPSVYKRYISKEEYVVYAARAIQEGEQLTCDYEVALGNEVTREENCCMDQVVRQSWSEKCRGLAKFWLWLTR